MVLIHVALAKAQVVLALEEVLEAQVAQAELVVSAVLEVLAAQAELEASAELAASEASAEWFVSTAHIRLHCRRA